MYKKQKERLSEYRKYLAGQKSEYQSPLKWILNESFENKDVCALFFEYESKFNDILCIRIDIIFYDNKGYLKKKDILNVIDTKFLYFELFFENAREFALELEDKRSKSKEYRLKYFQSKNEIEKDFFLLCWNNIKSKYKNIPNIIFLFKKDYALNLISMKEIEKNERMKIKKLLRSMRKY